jgi:hypothetical protein
LAKFEDLDKSAFYNNDLDDGNFATMPVGTDFENQGTITRASRMNDNDDFDFDNDDSDAPF